MLEKDKLKKLEKESLIDAFDLQENEVFEARQNLLGFFDTLNEIYERLKREGKLAKLKEDKRDD